MKTQRILSSLTGALISFLAISLVLFTAGAGSAAPYIAGAISGAKLTLDLSGITLYKSNGMAFASMLSGEPITFSGTPARRALIEPAFRNPALNEIHTIVGGITHDIQVAFAGLLGNAVVADPGCASTEQTNPISITAKTWSPTRLEMHLSQCYSDLDTTLFAYNATPGLAGTDLSRSEFADLALELMEVALTEAIWRLAWFGDTDAAAGGYITNTAKEPYYTPMDGFWTKIQDAVTATTMTNVGGPPATANGQATKAVQLSNLVADTDGAYQTFKSLIEDSDTRLSARGDRMILCTRTLWDNWLSWKESKDIDTSFVRQDVNFQTDVYRGVRIVAINLWDRKIQADMDDGTVYEKPHRALLTTRENLQIGFGEPANGTEVEIWQRRIDKTTHFRANYAMDVQIPWDFMAIASY